MERTGRRRRGRARWLAGAVLIWCVPSAVAAQVRTLTLEDAVDLAMRDNRELVEARLGMEGARQQVREAWSHVMPTLDINANYTRNLSVPATFLPRIFIDPDASPDELVAVRFGTDNAWGFTLRAEQPLFRAAALIGVGAAGQFASLQEEAVRGTALNVATTVRLAYYDVLLADEALRLHENTVTRVTQTLNETRALERAGLVSAYDVLRLEVELANVEPNLRRARNTAAAARRALAVHIGTPSLDSVEVATSLHVLAAASLDASGVAAESPGAWSIGMPDLPEALALARAYRSELRQLALLASLRQAEVRAEQAEYLPRIALFATYQIQAQQAGAPAFFGRSEADRAYGRQVGVQVSVPLFAGFGRPARVAQLRAVQRQVQVQHDQLADRVEHEVRTLLDQVAETAARRSARQHAVAQAERGFEIAGAQYRAGVGTALELTDAELALRQSEFHLAEAVYDALVARARLDAAVGVVPGVVASVITMRTGETRR